MVKQSTIITIQSDIKKLSIEQEEILKDYCSVYSHLERVLFNYLKDKDKLLEYSNSL